MQIPPIIFRPWVTSEDSRANAISTIRNIDGQQQKELTAKPLQPRTITTTTATTTTATVIKMETEQQSDFTAINLEDDCNSSSSSKLSFNDSPSTSNKLLLNHSNFQQYNNMPPANVNNNILKPPTLIAANAFTAHPHMYSPMMHHMHQQHQHQMMANMPPVLNELYYNANLGMEPYSMDFVQEYQRLLAEEAQQKAINARKQRPKKYKCPHCTVAFSNNGQLKGHIRIHTGERPYKCDVEACGKTFTRNEELTRHKRIHTGLRPFPCNVCGKKFGRRDHLKKHMKTHMPQERSPLFMFPYVYGY